MNRTCPCSNKRSLEITITFQAEFAIEPGLVTLVKFSSGNKPPVKGIIDVPMKLKDLIKVKL